jgi:RNA polymerase sigma factor (sigma-70 family)
MSKCKIYTILIKKKRIPVTEEVYREYYRYKEHETYMDKLAIKNNLSIEECDKNGNGLEYILSKRQESTEDKLIHKEMLLMLSKAIELLTEQEKFLIYSMFFKGKSERELCNLLGIAKTTLHDRKQKILKKLKKFLET